MSDVSDIEDQFDDSDKYTLDIEDENTEILDDENVETFDVDIDEYDHTHILEDSEDEIEEEEITNTIDDNHLKKLDKNKKNIILSKTNIIDIEEDLEEIEDEYDEEDLDEQEEYIEEINTSDDINNSLTLFNTKPIIIESSNITHEYIVDPKNRITSNYFTIYEYSQVIGYRAEQISNGSKIFIDYNNLTDSILIAKKELLAKKCPLSILRPIGLDKYECWSANELMLL
jgi:DNA-directed RNA polymerase subunit K/omega